MKVQVCTGKMCSERFSSYIIDRLEKDKEFFKFDKLSVEPCMCTGNCKVWPSVIFDGEVQTHMNPVKASDIARGKKQIQKAWEKKKYKNNSDKKK